MNSDTGTETCDKGNTDQNSMLYVAVIGNHVA